MYSNPTWGTDILLGFLSVLTGIDGGLVMDRSAVRILPDGYQRNSDNRRRGDSDRSGLYH